MSRFDQEKILNYFLDQLNKNDLKRMLVILPSVLSLTTVSELLGHSSVSITLDRYFHPSEAEKKKCMMIFKELNS